MLTWGQKQSREESGLEVGGMMGGWEPVGAFDLRVGWGTRRPTKREGEGRSKTDSPQGWRSLAPWSVQSTFQSVSRDAPQINGFPVAGGTTPSRGFSEGSVGRPPFGVSGGCGWIWTREVDGGERERSVGAEGVGGVSENGGVFEFPNWQHKGEALANPKSSHCLLFTHTVDSKQWHTHTFGTVWWRLEVKHKLSFSNKLFDPCELT